MTFNLEDKTYLMDIQGEMERESESENERWLTRDK